MFVSRGRTILLMEFSGENLQDVLDDLLSSLFTGRLSARAGAEGKVFSIHLNILRGKPVCMYVEKLDTGARLSGDKALHFLRDLIETRDVIAEVMELSEAEISLDLREYPESMLSSEGRKKLSEMIGKHHSSPEAPLKECLYDLLFERANMLGSSCDVIGITRSMLRAILKKSFRAASLNAALKRFLVEASSWGYHALLSCRCRKGVVRVFIDESGKATMILFESNGETVCLSSFEEVVERAGLGRVECQAYLIKP